ncbi:MAG: histidine kinase [Flavobacteriales bacterium]|nr:histidine kinase [Flavobacteriales bacterium]
MKKLTLYSYWLLIFVSVFHTSFLFAQKVSYSFSEQNGLPTAEVYDCAQDDRGYLWISTKEGIVRYDGRDFVHYSTADGLSTNFNWKINKDASNRIWLGNNVTPFTYIKDDSVHRVGENYPKFYYENLLEDHLGNTYIISLREGKTYCIDKKDKVIIIDSLLLMVTENDELIYGSEIKYGAKAVRLKSSFQNYALLISESSGVSICIYNRNKELVQKVGLSNGYPDLKVGEYNLQFVQNDLYVSSGGLDLLKFASENDFQREIVQEYKKGEFEPASVFLDYNNNFWVADVERGLSCFYAVPPKVKFSVYPNGNKAYRCINWIGDTYGLSFADGQNRILDRTSVVFSYKDPNKQGFVAQYGDKFVIANDKGIRLILDTISQKEKKIQVVEMGQTEVEYENAGVVDIPVGGIKSWSFVGDTLLLGTHMGAQHLVFGDDKVEINKYYYGYVYALNSIKECQWIGTSNELLVSCSGSSEPMVIQEGSVKAILEWNDQVVVRMESGEIFFFDPLTFEKINVWEQYKRFHGLQLFEDKLVLLGTDELLLMEENGTLSISEGLHGGKVLQLLKLDQTYRIIAELGTYEFDDLEVWTSYEQQEKLIISSIDIRRGYKKGEQIILEDDDNFLSIELTAFMFPTSEDLIYYYRMDDGEWIRSNGNVISMFNIQYGEHQLEMKAMKPSGEIYSTEIILNISNPQPFYLSTLFYLLVVIVISLLVITSLLVVQKRRLHLLKLSYETAESKQKMLIMQMKPHFLSNLFNSLQSGLLNDDVEKNSILLSKADRYLRKTLKISQESLISLEQELDFVSDYVDLERTRFTIPIKLKFSFDQARFNKRVKLPVFILQPLVENALWHGIHKSKELAKGEVIVSLEESEDYFEISISDNGVGVGKFDRTGNSISLKNIAERLKLIDPKKREKYYQFVEVTQGTKIIIYVAKQVKDHTYRR